MSFLRVSWIISDPEYCRARPSARDIAHDCIQACIVPMISATEWMQESNLLDPLIDGFVRHFTSATFEPCMDRAFSAASSPLLKFSSAHM